MNTPVLLSPSMVRIVLPPLLSVLPSGSRYVPFLTKILVLRRVAAPRALVLLA